jgi:hypothetical protein
MKFCRLGRAAKAELREAQHADFVGLRSSTPTYNVQSIAILGQPPNSAELTLVNLSRCTRVKLDDLLTF